MARKIAKLILAGAVTPFIGVGIYLLQLQVNPQGVYGYLLVQCLLSLVFLAYFSCMGYFYSKNGPIRGFKLLFFLIPLGFTFMSLAYKLWVSSNIPAAVLLSGIEVPFHYVLTYLYYLAGPYYLLPSVVPILVCFLSFQLGGLLGRHTVKRRDRAKGIKKIGTLLCIAIFCAAIVLSTRPSVLPQSAPSDVFSMYELEAGLVPGIAVSQGTSREDTKNPDVVCVMRIYSDPGSAQFSFHGGMDFGHTFLTFLNVSSSDITVGCHTVAPNQMVSVGKFGNLTDHASGFKGVFYNIESQRTQRFGWYAAGRSIYMDLTASELNTVSHAIKQMQSGYIEVGNNCAAFAGLVWNSILSSDHAKYMDHIGTPSLIYRELGSIGGCYTGNGIIQADYAPCYYSGSVGVICEDKY